MLLRITEFPATDRGKCASSLGSNLTAENFAEFAPRQDQDLKDTLWLQSFVSELPKGPSYRKSGPHRCQFFQAYTENESCISQQE